jgi:hypothetical protein
MWIGAVYADLEPPVDCTYMVNPMINYGMTVTTEFLENITGYTPLSWKYLDSKSLEEKDFPSAGFVIDDSESEEAEDGDSGNANADHTE